jgi:1-acyl-sn-glycerol-3-phosphate acyltransferase
VKLFDPFGNPLLIKRLMFGVFGSFFYIGLCVINRLRIQGTEVLRELPDRNVLFVSNHQTYYRDVMAIFHSICAAKWGFGKRLWAPIYLLWTPARLYYVAASETMKQSGFLPWLFSLAGAVTVTRSWREGGKEVQRQVDVSEVDKIFKALDFGWVVTFPQGTTRPFAEGRKGVAHIIQEQRPVVVPVVINGFRRAFNKKGLLLKKRNVDLTVTFKEPLVLSDEATREEIMDRIMDAIEQSDRYRFPHDKKDPA